MAIPSRSATKPPRAASTAVAAAAVGARDVAVANKAAAKIARPRSRFMLVLPRPRVRSEPMATSGERTPGRTLDSREGVADLRGRGFGYTVRRTLLTGAAVAGLISA